MIKVKNNIASREPLPEFLKGLDSETLLDLSWTDESLGVRDCAWWGETDKSRPLGQFEKYGEEILTLDTANKQVIVTKEILPWSQEEINEYNKNSIPTSVTMRQGRLALLEMDMLDAVEAAIQSIQDTTQKRAAQIEWEYAQTIERNSQWVYAVSSTVGLSENDLDNLFIRAAML